MKSRKPRVKHVKHVKKAMKRNSSTSQDVLLFSNSIGRSIKIDVMAALRNVDVQRSSSARCPSPLAA
jgi:hypothetical protein